MPKPLKVEDVTTENVREICVLRADKIQVGREIECGVLLDNPAVSRIHGAFLPLRNHWFYKDFGSTNGSWVNEAQIPPGTMRIVRPGDYVQLADVVLRLTPLNPEPEQIDPFSKAYDFWSLIVFADGDDIRDEFPIPKFGKALIVGGKEGDLQFPEELEGHVQENPSIVFERRKDAVYVFRVDTKKEALLNGLEITQSQKLKDGDKVVTGPFSILFNCPSASASEESKQEPRREQVKVHEQLLPVEQGSDIRGWDDMAVEGEQPLLNIPTRKTPVSQGFGSTSDENGTTIVAPSQSFYSKLTHEERPTEIVSSEEYRSAYADSMPVIQKPSLFRPLMFLFAGLCAFMLMAVAAFFLR